jgi:hypothetical protein
MFTVLHYGDARTGLNGALLTPKVNWRIQRAPRRSLADCWSGGVACAEQTATCSSMETFTKAANCPHPLPRLMKL